MALDPREWEQFLAQAAIKCTGASRSGVTVEAYDVFKEFFNDSNSWTEDILFSALADTTDYDLSPLDGGKIIRLVAVWGTNNCVEPAVMTTFGTVTLINTPNVNATSQWLARVVKTIALPTLKDGVPDAPEWALSVYSIHLLDGLLGKMMAQPNKSWSNPTQSTYHLRRFRTGIQVARTAAVRANLVGGQEWAYPANATRGTQRSGGAVWPRGM